jgi:hypothetical protein
MQERPSSRRPDSVGRHRGLAGHTRGERSGCPWRPDRGRPGAPGEDDPDPFPNAVSAAASGSGAIAWEFDQGVFEAINHTRNAYDVVKRECQPKTAAEMWEYWIADVLARKAEQANSPAVAHAQPF